MLKRIYEWWLDRRAANALDEQFANKTGHPTYGATTQDGRAFRQSGLTAHEWLMKH